MAPRQSKRTGQFIRDELSRTPASISELHQAYKDKINVLNEGRDKLHKLKRPAYSSFYQYFRHFIVLGLVEQVGEKPVLPKYPGEAGITTPDEMGFIEEVAGQLKVHKGAVRRLWKLTPQGETEVEAWENPIKARGYSKK